MFDTLRKAVIKSSAINKDDIYSSVPSAVTDSHNSTFANVAAEFGHPLPRMVLNSNLRDRDPIDKLTRTEHLVDPFKLVA